MLSNSLALIKTRSDQLEALDALDKLQVDLYKQQDGVSDRKIINQKIEVLRTQIKKMRVLKVVIAVRPTELMVADLGRKVKTVIGEEAIIDIDTDPTILAGAKIYFEGRYGDFSLGDKIQDYMSAHEDKIRGDLGL